MADPIYIHLVPEQTLPALSEGAFKAVVIIEEPSPAAWRDKVCEWLVNSGCLYCCVWGETCEAWHDGVDDANIRTFDGAAIPDERFIMTTWHDSEPLSEALWFVGHAAEHPTVAIDGTVIVHIARHERAKDLVKQFQSATAE